MKTLQSLSTQLETLEVTNKTILNSLKGSFVEKKNSTEWETYKTNDALITKLKRDILNVKQTQHIESVNNFHNIINTLMPSISSYNGSFINKDGSTPKKFKDFLSTLDLQGIHVYCTQRYSFSSPELVFSGSNSLKYTIDIDRLDKFEGLKNFDIKEILKAQEEHNKLLKELEQLQKQVSDNYLKATADYNISHSGNKYKF